MIPRYQTATMRDIFCDEAKYKTWLMIELAYVDGYLQHHNKADPALMTRLQNKAKDLDWPRFINSLLEKEQETRHDVIAFLQVLEQEFLQDARLIHIGLTSSDIVDTANALLIKKALIEIINKLDGVIKSLLQQAKKYRGVLCLGRTHGQAAEPITFGIKLLSFVAEFHRSKNRLLSALDECSVGKLSGATGVYGLVDPQLEHMVLNSLGLKAETVATQVVARDRYAFLCGSMAILAGSIERFATEMRLLMHGQLQEISEPFSALQKGSSAMPHKKNPILSENLCGLMRLVRSYAQVAMENQALWHERDISHSSTERVMIPDMFSLMDFALVRLDNLVTNMVVHEQRMQKNLDDVALGLHSQHVLKALIDKGLMRKAAYEIVQKAALMSNITFKEALLKAGILEHMSSDELAIILTLDDAVRHEGVLFDRVAKLIEKR